MVNDTRTARRCGLGRAVLGLGLGACSASPRSPLPEAHDTEARSSTTGAESTTEGDSPQADSGSSGAGDPSPPTDPGEVSRGGTMTFTNIGAPGYWGRRIEADEGDPRCDVQAEWLDLGFGDEFCCRTRHEVVSDRLTPFSEPMSLVIRGPLELARFVVYQPRGAGWTRTSSWDRSDPRAPDNVQITGPDGAPFTGDLGNACHAYLMQAIPFPCGPGSDPYCPPGGPDVEYEGWRGSKLLVFQMAMPYAQDSTAPPCAEPGDGWTDAPWVGLSASELIRDGWGKYHPCHCYANTDPGVGDGCGEINLFEVVSEAEGPMYGNRDVMSTGLRSFQLGHLGGSICGLDRCEGLDFIDDTVELFDACAHAPLEGGAVLDAEADGAGCPVWRRPQGSRYFVALLDEDRRTVQVALVHPDAIPIAAQALLPHLPPTLDRSAIDDLLAVRLP